MKNVEEWMDIQAMHRRGMSISDIARKTGRSRKTIRKYLKEPQKLPEYTENQFAKAQEILAERRDNPSLRRSNRSDYPLSGLLRCVRCGKGLVGASAHGRNRVYSYYACPEKLKSGECDLESLPKERIERAIIDQIKRIFLNRKLIEGLLERVRAKQANNLPEKTS